MRKFIKTSIGETYAAEHRRRKNWKKVVAVLSCFVVIATISALTLPAITMNQIACGMEEHKHDDSCFNLEKTLICNKIEHTHSADCQVNKMADVETDSDWESSLPKRTGVWADDVVSIAKKQIGYTESNINFLFAEDNETRKGYTRYGAWAGNPYSDWNDIFVAFCLHYAGITEENFPVVTGAEAWSTVLKDKGMYELADGYTPVAGDLVFLDTDANNTIDSVGILEKIELPADDNVVPKLQVIQGDYAEPEAVGHAVCLVEYTLEDVSILGYGVLPEQRMLGNNEILTYQGEDLNISVTWSEEVKLPMDTELLFYEYGRTHEEWLTNYAKATENAAILGAPEDETAKNTQYHEFRLFSIGVYADGKEITPAAPMCVNLSLKRDSERSCQLMNFTYDGAYVKSESTFNDGIQVISFEAELPGLYGIIWDEDELNAEPTTLTYPGEDYSITVTYGPEAGLLENTELVINEYDEDSEILFERYMQAQTLYGWTEGEFHPFRLFDIALTVNGEAVQPLVPVEVAISMSLR